MYLKTFPASERSRPPGGTAALPPTPLPGLDGGGEFGRRRPLPPPAGHRRHPRSGRGGARCGGRRRRTRRRALHVRPRAPRPSPEAGRHAHLHAVRTVSPACGDPEAGGTARPRAEARAVVVLEGPGAQTAPSRARARPSSPSTRTRSAGKAHPVATNRARSLASTAPPAAPACSWPGPGPGGEPGHRRRRAVRRQRAPRGRHRGRRPLMLRRGRLRGRRLRPARRAHRADRLGRRGGARVRLWTPRRRRTPRGCRTPSPRPRGGVRARPAWHRAVPE